MNKRLAAGIVVSLALIFMVAPLSAGAGGFCSGHEGEVKTTGSGSTVEMSENCFRPTVLRVQQGAKVTFVNNDPDVHSVGGVGGSFGDMHKEIPPGESVTYAFKEKGVYPYACIFHPGMAGAVVVGDGEGPAASTGTASGVTQPSAGATSVAGSQGTLAVWLGLGIALVLLVAAVVSVARALTRARKPSAQGVE